MRAHELVLVLCGNCLPVYRDSMQQHHIGGGTSFQHCVDILVILELRHKGVHHYSTSAKLNSSAAALQQQQQQRLQQAAIQAQVQKALTLQLQNSSLPVGRQQQQPPSLSPSSSHGDRQRPPPRAPPNAPATAKDSALSSTAQGMTAQQITKASILVDAKYCTRGAHCSTCGKMNHTAEQCFRTHGMPKDDSLYYAIRRSPVYIEQKARDAAAAKANEASMVLTPLVAQAQGATAISLVANGSSLGHGAAAGPGRPDPPSFFGMSSLDRGPAPTRTHYPTEWVLDSGASQHATAHVECLRDARVDPDLHLRSACGGVMSGPAVGSMCIVGIDGRVLELSEVSSHPSMVKNLLSVGCLEKDGYPSTFSADHKEMHVWNAAKELVLRARSVDGSAYIIQLDGPDAADTGGAPLGRDSLLMSLSSSKAAASMAAIVIEDDSDDDTVIMHNIPSASPMVPPVASEWPPGSQPDMRNLAQQQITSWLTQRTAAERQDEDDGSQPSRDAVEFLSSNIHPLMERAIRDVKGPKRREQLIAIALQIAAVAAQDEIALSDAHREGEPQPAPPPPQGPSAAVEDIPPPLGPPEPSPREQRVDGRREYSEAKDNGTVTELMARRKAVAFARQQEVQLEKDQKEAATAEAVRVERVAAAAAAAAASTGIPLPVKREAPHPGGHGPGRPASAASLSAKPAQQQGRRPQPRQAPVYVPSGPDHPLAGEPPSASTAKRHQAAAQAVSQKYTTTGAKCPHCNGIGHTEAQCFRLVGYPPRESYYWVQAGGYDAALAGRARPTTSSEPLLQPPSAAVETATHSPLDDAALALHRLQQFAQTVADPLEARAALTQLTGLHRVLDQLSTVLTDRTRVSTPSAPKEASAAPVVSSDGTVHIAPKRCCYQSPPCHSAAQWGWHCPYHTSLVQGLQIGRSRVKGAGNGLYVTRFFETGAIVAYYTGMMIQPLDHVTPPSGRYVMELNRNLFVDASRTDVSPARFINDGYRPDGTDGNNVMFQVRTTRQLEDELRTPSSGGPDEKHVVVRATVDLHIGTELLIPYGKLYWATYDPAIARNYQYTAKD